MKSMNVANKVGALVALVVGFGFAGIASATAPDYSSITSAVDFAAVSTAIITVLAAVALVLVAYKGGKLLMKALA
jgi:hypothetical protein